MIALLIIIGMLRWTSPALAAENVATDVRVQEISRHLRCLVCDGQSLADSHAGAAVAMREEIRRQLAAGKSEPEILETFARQYGPSVLWKPPLIPSTTLLWFGPALLLAVGGAALFVSLRPPRAP